MSALARLQEDFQAYLLHDKQDMTDQVIGTAKADVRERLAVYGNAYRLRLLEALGTDFPVLHALAGDSAFDRLGRAYIDAHPSAHPSLRWFGRHMSDFLAQTSPYAAHPVLAEMAAFEWAQGEVFDAADSGCVSVEAIASQAPEAWPGMRLVLHPSVRRLDLEWNVPPVWQIIDKNKTPPAPARGERAVSWLLWRRELEIHWRSLEPDEAWAIDACARGQTFSELCEGLCQWIEASDAALRAAGMLKRWLIDGLVTRAETAGSLP